MAPFVWGLMGGDAGESLAHIIIRKESERCAGHGEFWWGLGTPLGKSVEIEAVKNGGTLQAIFSAIQDQDGDPTEQVWAWNGWESIDYRQMGRIPNHVLVTSSYKPDKAHYALVCRSAAKLDLGIHGAFDPAQCRTVAGGKPPGYSQKAALLTGSLVHSQGPYSVNFIAELIDPFFVRLTDPRPLSAAELNTIRNFSLSDDWLPLVQGLRRLSLGARPAQDIPGTKLAEQLLARPEGATMDEIVAATGGPQYNVLRKLEGRGYRIRKVKEGRATRYFATPPDAPSFEATITSKGQVTIPQDVRDRLRLRSGQKVRFAIEDENRVVITPASSRLADLAGVLGTPKRNVTLEEMDEAIHSAAVKRFFRAVGKKR